MSVKASLSLGISVLVVSTKPGNTPRQAILKKKDFFLVMVGRHPEFLSRSGLKASPLALCLSLERWLELVTLQRRAMCAGGLPLQEWKERKRRGAGLPGRDRGVPGSFSVQVL